MVLQQLKTILKKAFSQAGFNQIEPKMIVSNRPDLCDYQSDSCFMLAKQLHQNPWDIAQKVLLELQKDKGNETIFAKIDIVRPGFLNFTLADQFLTNCVERMLTQPKFGLEVPNKQETYVLDYGGPNVAKPLHVGHLRSAIVGESVKRIIEWYGHKVISDVHLGDYGLQIGQVIYGAMLDHKQPKDLTLQYLDTIYPKMSALSKTDEVVKEKCAQITKELQEGNAEYKKYWKAIVSISKADIARIYDYLDVHFDYWLGESDSYQDIPALEKYLNDRSLLYTSQGARVMDIAEDTDKKEMPPLLFQKSNGAYLYATTDFATIWQRIRDWDPDHILYFTDIRQAQHFESVFRACKKAGLIQNGRPQLEFCGFGTVNGVDGKPFKTRAGDSPKLDSLFRQVKEVFMGIKESNKQASQEDLDKIVNAIIKFADLQNAKERDYIFDIQKFSNIVGKTGPYILYTYLRVKNILMSNTIDNHNQSGIIYNEIDRKLRLELLKYFTIMPVAMETKSPSVICDYVYNLCTVTNSFYESNRISTLENLQQKQDWCVLLACVEKVMHQLFHIIGMEAPSVM